MDKRAEPRVNHNIRVFVHVHECKDHPDLVGTSLKCEAIDFSTRGMQFSCAESLPVSSILSITIGIGEPFAMYLLQGEVRWVRTVDGDFCMGVLLQQNDATDYLVWEHDFTNVFIA
jgi:hypothetical protein